MSKPKQHKDVEFAVENPLQGGEDVFKTFPEAAAHAIALAASRGETIALDVLIYSKAGARWWGGDEAVEMYAGDPEASVSQRVVVRAEDQGRIA